MTTTPALPAHAHRWATLDKTTWPDGPWLHEPDKVSWTDPGTDRPCLIVRHPINGYLCGYVGVDPDHPLHGVQFPEALAALWPTFDVPEINYSARCEEGAPEAIGICHVPAPGASDDVWWLGFMCGHAWDYSPGDDALLPDDTRYHELRARIVEGQTYRDLDTVAGVCAGLAQALVELQAAT